MLRKSFHQKLDQLHVSLLEMGSFVEKVIQLSIEGLEKQDVEKSEEAIKLDDKVDEIELEIEKQCLELLALQTPVAIDLRKISTILKMITDLERIADYGVNIAFDTKRMGSKSFIKPLEDIPKMADITKTMVRRSLDSFVKEDPNLAQEVAEMDDIVDDLYHKTYDELVSMLGKDEENTKQIVHLLFISRHLERMADHATNLCERIVYMTTSERMEF
ncbi:phosphate uptake regulator [Gottschalkia acidurici 9a]|uniref:Phosphate-specific transport system accessory protein PhoU n=1 Tax=Gottschalkia acidurici (strain ATCC 7906 / DSM 604 / BCRC 14475 / CIP 104303 / KCTC 5404 / NCIMB 10678 / 9a) TaxID=1128398 RepID=K0AYG0_GOTA9|nr:phosphate signaling complex protein PhoU [Gottschalkia acidurici]AFS78299.1 phosphate uptake regulator [Gottschalkia acidurici 9a]